VTEITLRVLAFLIAAALGAAALTLLRIELNRWRDWAGLVLLGLAQGLIGAALGLT
jgi:heme A synthase